MGSGRDDRNQTAEAALQAARDQGLQWGPVVMTGPQRLISTPVQVALTSLQWGPVVMTGISARTKQDDREMVSRASIGSGRGDRNQD